MTQQAEPAYLDYHVRWRAGAALTGKHATRQGGQGSGFREYRPFWQLPHARQIDIKRSVLNPFGELLVRQTEQHSSINVVLAIDLSCSMQPAPEWPGSRAAALLAAAAARSALRAGDGFGVVGFDTALRDDAWLPPTRSRAAARQMVAQLAGLARGGGADGIAELAGRLPARRCLVLLVSDFLMPMRLIARALATLARHDVAPVVIDAETASSLPCAGLLRLRDAESGRTRLVLMRPALRRRWQADAVARRRQLDLLFLQSCRPAFHAVGGLDVQALSDHLAGP